MSKRYTYSRAIITPEGEETYTADQFDSFDEAKRAVDRGIHDRRLELSLKQEESKLSPAPAPEEKIVVPPAGENGSTSSAGDIKQPEGISTSNQQPA